MILEDLGWGMHLMPSNLIQVQISISFWQSQQTESTKKLVFLKAIYFDAFVLDSLNYVSFFFLYSHEICCPKVAGGLHRIHWGHEETPGP